MGTPTNRFGLIKPGDPDFQDAAVLGLDFDMIDAQLGIPNVTSGTRPGSPVSGQVIYETDTGQTYRWDGTTWKWLSGSWLNQYSRASFSAAVATNPIGGLTRDSVSTGPDFSYTESPAGRFTLPRGVWGIQAVATVASASGQELQIYNINGGRVLARGTFANAAEPTGVSAFWYSDGTSYIQARYRNTSAAAVSWTSFFMFFTKISEF